MENKKHICYWCKKDATRLDYRERTGITFKIKSCQKCFQLDTKYLIKQYGK